MAGPDDDLEFLPSDDLEEVEPPGPEDGAVHEHEPDESRELLTVEAEEFDAERLDEDEADELEVEMEEAEEPEEEPAVAPLTPGEREEDLQEVLRRQYGLVSEQPDEDLAREEGVRPAREGEFVCRSCFLRRPLTQLSDAAAGTCVDCAAAGPVDSPLT